MFLAGSNIQSTVKRRQRQEWRVVSRGVDKNKLTDAHMFLVVIIAFATSFILSEADGVPTSSSSLFSSCQSERTRQPSFVAATHSRGTRLLTLSGQCASSQYQNPKTFYTYSFEALVPRYGVARSILTNRGEGLCSSRSKTKCLWIQSSNDDQTAMSNPTVNNFMKELSENDKSLLNDIWEEATISSGQTATDEGRGEEKAELESSTLELAKVVASQIQRFSPALIVQLRQFASSTSPEDVHSSSSEMNDVMELASKARAIGLALSTYLENSLQKGKDLLKTLLDAGEIRKLDSLIGKAAEQGKLDSSFFTVLNMNLNDALEAEQQQPEMKEEGGSANENEEGQGASRMSILQHIYTRCQEEIEKQVPPGVGLLNKLMRTEQPSIRKNQLEHYLGLPSDEKTITTPDGKTIPLKGSKAALVSTKDFIEAIQNTVKQVRMLERAGVTSKESSASVVESARNIAKEARIVIGTTYGPESNTLKEFEDRLMPVFRPSPSSEEYMPSTQPQQ